jgi:hypothetical protein
MRAIRIGVFDRSPASLWLAGHDLVDRGVPYRIMSPDPEEDPGRTIERDLLQGKIDAAIVWAQSAVVSPAAAVTRCAWLVAAAPPGRPLRDAEQVLLRHRHHRARRALR